MVNGEFEELEQQEPFTPSPSYGRQGGSNVRVRYVIIAGISVIALSTAAVMFGLSMNGNAVHQSAGQDSLDNLIQQHAFAKNGKMLTAGEIANAKNYLVKAKKHLPAYARHQDFGLLQAKSRTLLVDGTSPECQEALKQFVADSMEKALNLGMEAYNACDADEHSAECKAAMAKLDSFQDDMIEDCKGTGDVCDVTENLNGGSEPEKGCLPTACHSDEAVFEKLATDSLKDQHGCSDCSVTVDC